MSRPTQEQEAMNEREDMVGFEEWYYDTSNGMHIGTVVMSQRDAAARGWQAARRQDAETIERLTRDRDALLAVLKKL